VPDTRRWTRIAVITGAVVGLPLLLVGIFLALPYGAAASVLRPIVAVIDDAPGLPHDIDTPAQRSVVLAADGSVIAALAGEEDRVSVPLADVPEHVRDAVLAIEDAAFYEHAGVDHRAILRAAWQNLRARGIAEGGSTITQQYVKNAVLTSAQTIDRKTTEVRYAITLEERLDKDEILQRYLNTAYFGEGVYGIATAATFYFSKPAQELDLAEGALLAGLIAAPEHLNPAEDPDAARERRDLVLARMADEGYITPEQEQAAAAEPVEIDLTPLPPPDNPFFVEHVKQILFADEALGATRQERERRVFRGGLQVHTTLDPALQDAGEAAIAEILTDPLADPLAVLVSVAPATGAVRAMAIGPQEFGTCDEPGPCPRTQVNPAVPGLGGSGRQTGSAFKPIVLAAALDAGIPRGWQEITDSGQPIEGCSEDDGPWTPRNFDPADGGVKDMDEAVTVSNNVYHAKLMGLLEPEPVIEIAQRLGIPDRSLPATCSLGLGAGSVFPIEIAAAFSTIATGGERCDIHVITRVEQAGETLIEHDPTCEEALSPAVAAHVTDLLQGPVGEGTATAAQIGRPVAGKTGTTDDFHDAWFVGFVPQLTTAAWVGYAQPRPLEGIAGVEQVTGGSIPALLWASYMEVAVADLEPAGFLDPPAQETITVADVLGGTVDELTAAQEARDLNLHVTQVTDFRPTGTIVAQDPDPGARVARGQLLAVSVSDGTGEPPRVPSVIDRSEREARRILTDAGYEVEVLEEQRRVQLRPGEDPDPAEGTVIAQEPTAGAIALPGETVTITVVRHDVQRTDPTPGPPPGRQPPGSAPAPDQAGSDQPARAGDVVITQARPAPEPDREYVELSNATDRPIDVGSWTLLTDDGNRLDIAAGHAIAPRARFRVYSGAGQDRADRHYVGYDRSVLPAQGELRLLDAAGREIYRGRY
jgi:penicillin-binding protein 1A